MSTNDERIQLKSTFRKEIQENTYDSPFDMTDPDGYQAFIHAGAHSDSGCCQVWRVADHVGAGKLPEVMKERASRKRKIA